MSRSWCLNGAFTRAFPVSEWNLERPSDPISLPAIAPAPGQLAQPVIGQRQQPAGRVWVALSQGAQQRGDRVHQPEMTPAFSRFRRRAVYRLCRAARDAACVMLRSPQCACALSYRRREFRACAWALTSGAWRCTAVPLVSAQSAFGLSLYEPGTCVPAWLR